MKTIRFNADVNKVNEVAKKKTKHISRIELSVAWVGVAFLFMWLQELEELWEISDVTGFVKTCLFVGAGIEMVSSLIVLVFVSIEEGKLSQTFVAITNDRITGMYFNNQYSGELFEVTYPNLIEATILPENSKGNNICIRAMSGTFFCYAIEDKAACVKLINERKKEFDSEKQVSGANTMPLRGCCSNCGAMLPKEAAFCIECGKKYSKK